MHLPAVKLFSGHEVLQILMIHPDLNLMRTSLQIMPPRLQCSYYPQHLFVMHIIIPLHIIQPLGQICTRMPFVIFAQH